MKKLTAILLALLLAAALPLALASCADDGKYTIGVVQLVTHDALDAATNGFMQAVKDEMGEENVTFDVQNAGGDAAMCKTITDNFASKNVDLIMANATPAMLACATATADIPVLATSITNYESAMEIELTAEGATGLNVSGTSDLAPLDQQAQMLHELFPEAKVVILQLLQKDLEQTAFFVQG